MAESGVNDAAVIVLIALAGLAIGSFIGAVAVRLIVGKNPVSGRSRCDSCRRQLRAVDLVPLLSFAVLRGRCRACSAPIDRLHPAAEGGSMAIALAAWFLADAPLDAVLAMVFGWQLLLLALIDFRTCWLPDALIALLAATALLIPASAFWQFADGSVALAMVFDALTGALVGFVLLALPAVAYKRIKGQAGMGSADPPLMAAIGLWMGPTGVVFTVLTASFAGLGAVLVLRIAGREIARDTPLALGGLLAISAIVLNFAGLGM